MLRKCFIFSLHLYFKYSQNGPNCRTFDLSPTCVLHASCKYGPKRAKLRRFSTYPLHVSYMCFLVPHVFRVRFTSALHVYSKNEPKRAKFKHFWLISYIRFALFCMCISNMAQLGPYCRTFDLSPTCVLRAYYICWLAPEMFRMCFLVSNVFCMRFRCVFRIWPPKRDTLEGLLTYLLHVPYLCFTCVS